MVCSHSSCILDLESGSSSRACILRITLHAHHTTPDRDLPHHLNPYSKPLLISKVCPHSPTPTPPLFTSLPPPTLPLSFFFFNNPPPTEIPPLPLRDALPT